MWFTATGVIHSMVLGRCACVLATIVSCAETAEPAIKWGTCNPVVMYLWISVLLPLRVNEPAQCM